MVTSMEMVVKAAKDSKDGYYDMRFLEVMFISCCAAYHLFSYYSILVLIQEAW